MRAILAARSPGAREDGALLQTKLAYLDRYDPGNHERVLGDPRFHDGGDPAGGGGNPVGGVAGGGDPLPVPGGPGGGGFGDDPGGPAASFADSAGTLFPALGGLVGGGSGGGGGGTTTPTTPTTPVVALPEPATWLSMIVGLFAVATVMRRRPGGRAQSLR